MSEFLDENRIPEGEFPAPAPRQSRFSNTLFLTVVVLVVVCSNAIAFALGMIVQQRNARPYEYVINTTNPDYDFVGSNGASVLAAARAVNASVELRLQGPAKTVYGSGVIVGRRDLHPLILTNYHVLSRFVSGDGLTSTVTPAVRLAGSPAWIENGKGERLIRLLGYERVWLESDGAGRGRNDLALLELNIDVLNVADCVVGWNFDPIPGERVLAVGNARANGTSVTAGVVSKADYVAHTSSSAAEQYARYLVHSAPINRGNSGGAVVDLDGALIGVNTSVPAAGEDEEIQGISYAVPAAAAAGFVGRVLAADTTAGDLSRRDAYVRGETATRAVLEPFGVTYELAPSVSAVYEPSRLEVRAVTGESGTLAVGDRLLGFGVRGAAALSDVFYAKAGDGSYAYVYRRGARWPSALSVEDVAYRIAPRGADEAPLVIRVQRGAREVDCAFDAWTLRAVYPETRSNS